MMMNSKMKKNRFFVYVDGWKDDDFFAIRGSGFQQDLSIGGKE